MSLARTSLRTFLASSRRSLLSATSTSPLSIVFGNESADIDSFASSLLYAYLTPTRPTIPLLTIPRSDISLRPELLHLLDTVHLSADDILCLSDAPPSSLPKTTSQVLVDWNTSPFKFPVASIIDHHLDERKHLDAHPRIVEKAGSCASLVTNHFRPQWETMEAGNGELEKLVLAAILIDTFDMTLRVTSHDVAAVEFLLSRLNAAGTPAWDRRRFFDGVYDAKMNPKGLSLRDLLRKDYKEWTEATSASSKKLGIAAIVTPLSELVKKPDLDGFFDAVKSWGNEKGLDVVSIVTSAGKGDTFSREMMVWSLNEGALNLEFFEQRANEQGFRLKTWEEGKLDAVGRKAWVQGNLAASRKHISPLLRECLRDARSGEKI